MNEPILINAEEAPPSGQCNFYCRDGLHAHAFYADGLMADGDQEIRALIVKGHRIDIVEWREAPELPPIDPTDPQRREWPFRYVLWTRTGHE